MEWKNDRHSFRRVYVFVIYVRLDARELSVRFVVWGYGKYLVRIDLVLIQGLGISLGSFHYLIQWLTSSKTYYIRRLWSIVDLETKSQTHSSLLYLAVSFLSLPTMDQNFNSSPFLLIKSLLDHWKFARIIF